jgi:hypothetical protein
MQTVDIVSLGGLVKTCDFCGFLGRGGWFQVRYPGGAGLWAFSLRHGKMEAERGEHSQWSVAPAHLEAVRALAKEEKVKFTLQTPKAKKQNRPARPVTPPKQRQTEMF